MDRVLVTGASGGVGQRLRKLMQGSYKLVRISGRKQPPDMLPGEEFMAADLADMPSVERLVEAVDGIVHLGAMSVENDWPTILSANIVGTYNLYEAARQKGVKRIVFASTNHVVGFYRRNRRIGNAVLPRPDSRYGVSKVFGEALGSFYADKFGLRVLNVRIGNVHEKPLDRRRLAMWLKPEDFWQLVKIGLHHPDLHCETVYGVSDCERGWWDNEAAYRLGYKPEGKAEAFAEHALAEQAKAPPDPIGDLFEGGTFASKEFSGDLGRI